MFLKAGVKRFEDVEEVWCS